jgi:glucokinase
MANEKLMQRNDGSMKVGIGVDMGGTRIKIGLVDAGKIIAAESIPAAAEVSLAQRLEEIAVEVNRLLAANNCSAKGIGIAFPGIVDSTRKKILSKYVKYPDARQIDLEAWAQKKWGIPLAAENDARAALVGEWQYGAGRDCNDLVLITLGTGVGSAALVEGKILRGKHHLAGNLGGHLSINFQGEQCNCGHIGCVESEASTWALRKNVMRSADFKSSALSVEKEIDFNTVFRCAAAGDKLAGEIREHCLKVWSFAIMNLILSYDPERVVIGGGIMKSKDLIIPHVKEMIKNDNWINDNHIDLVAAEQVEYAGILGMYYLITQEIKDRKFVL